MSIRVKTIYGELDASYYRDVRGGEFLCTGVDRGESGWVPDMGTPPILLPRDLLNSAKYEEYLSEALMEGVQACAKRAAALKNDDLFKYKPPAEAAHTNRGKKVAP
jgi:hypothetical protein